MKCQGRTLKTHGLRPGDWIWVSNWVESFLIIAITKPFFAVEHGPYKVVQITVYSNENGVEVFHWDALKETELLFR